MIFANDDINAGLPRPLKAMAEFLRLESAGGILLVLAGTLAMILANTPLSHIYDRLLDTIVAVHIGAFHIDKPLLLWINDGMMAAFFLLIGLEVKREILEGQLSKPSQIALPGVAALGGMVVPAMVYAALNYKDHAAMAGWAIPTATDIAFALGVLSLLGKRVPTALKLFLMTLAVLDDLGAIIIIAAFYTHELSMLSFTVAGVALVVLFILNRMRIMHTTAYLFVGVILWASVLKSGIHATLAGVALAFFVPLGTRHPDIESPLRKLEHALHPWVAFGILPVFAFANAGVSLKGLTPGMLLDPVPFGVTLGLLFGKQIGVYTFSWALVKCRLAELPPGVRWRDIYGASVLCGIGFTMSLFIGSLAFEHESPGYATSNRLGILLGSLFAAVWGYVFLRLTLPKDAKPSGES